MSNTADFEVSYIGSDTKRHARMNATADQLKSAPVFKYSGRWNAGNSRFRSNCLMEIVMAGIYQAMIFCDRTNDTQPQAQAQANREEAGDLRSQFAQGKIHR